MNPFKKGIIDNEGLAEFARRLDRASQAERIPNMGFPATAEVIASDEYSECTVERIGYRPVTGGKQ